MRVFIALALTTACCRNPTPEPAASPAPPPPRAERVEGSGFDADLAATRAFSADRPTEETPLDDGVLPVEGVGGTRAADCGACHVEIYREWSVSTHAHAWTDPQFQAEITKSDNTWLCRNCHTPLRAQQPEWPIRLTAGDVEAPVLVPNPRFDKSFQDEGVTCAGCHVRDGRIQGPGLPDSRAPHPVDVNADLRSEAVCVRCHQAERIYPGKTFVCTFTTGAEWAASPYAERGQTCAHCHMPEVERPVATGGPIRTVRRHWFKGSGIPKWVDRAPPDDASPPPGLDIALQADGEHVVVTLRNAHAGHRLPSGDPERWIQVEGTFYDKDGATIGDGWSHRIGQVWRWRPTPRKIDDNRLGPMQSRQIRVRRPHGATRFEIRAASHRMSRKNADYHNLGDYPLSIDTHATSLTLSASSQTAEPDSGRVQDVP